MPLYMIRLHDGNSVLLVADSEEDALKKAGIRFDIEAALASANDLNKRFGRPEIGMDEFVEQLASSGFDGHTPCTIRELKKFVLDVELQDDGEFKFTFFNRINDALEEFMEDYPVLHKVAVATSELEHLELVENDELRENLLDRAQRYMAGEELEHIEKSPGRVAAETLMAEAVIEERARLAPKE